jgi:hypothetical protein
MRNRIINCGVATINIKSVLIILFILLLVIEYQTEDEIKEDFEREFCVVDI